MRHKGGFCLSVCPRESLLAEMGVSIKEDGGTLGVFSPKGVSHRKYIKPHVHVVKTDSDNNSFFQCAADASPGEPERGSSDVRVSAVLHQGGIHQVSIVILFIIQQGNYT